MTGGDGDGIPDSQDDDGGGDGVPRHSLEAVHSSRCA